MYRLCILGSPALARDGDPIDLAVGKPFALLCHLVLEGRPVSRDQLRELLWPDAPDAKAKQSVRQALSILRNALGSPELFKDHEVGIDPSEWTTDLDEVRAYLDRGQIRAARSRWAGPPLDGIVVSGSRAWTFWRDELRDTLTRGVADRIEKIGRSRAAKGDYDGAIEAFEFGLVVSPDNGSLTLGVARAALTSGKLRRARAAVERLRGRDLSKPRRAEFESIDEAVTLAEARSETDPTEHVQLELVGRAGELTVLAEAWAQVRVGETMSLLVRGASGVGKTRLALEMMSLARMEGGRTFVVEAHGRSASLEWGGVKDLARLLLDAAGSRLIGPSTNAIMRSLVPSRADDQIITPIPFERVSLADALSDLIDSVCYEGPVLIVVEDLQWMDPASVDTLVHVAQRMRSTPVLFLFTHRSAGAAPIDGLGRDLLLKPLTRTEVAELVSLTVEIPSEATSRLLEDLLWNASAGSPLYLHEAFGLLQDRGVVELSDDGTRVLNPGRISPEGIVLGSLGQLIARRLEGLDPAALRVLRLLAGSPRPLDTGRLAAVLEAPHAEVERTTQDLTDRDILRYDPEGRLFFSHDELRQAVSTEHTMARPKRWMGPLAAAVVLVLLGLAWGVRTDSWALGHGKLILHGEGGALELRPPESPTGSWEVKRAVEWIPEVGRAIRQVQRMPLTGEVAFFTTERSLEDAPFVARVGLDGKTDTVFRIEGDSNVQAISPDGRNLLITAEDTTTGAYDHDLFVFDSRSRESRMLYGASGKFSAVRWSPDGSRILVVTQGRPDTLRVMDAFGTLYETRLLDPDLSIAAWCDWGGRLPTVDESTGISTLGLYDLETAEFEAVGDYQHVRSVICLPGGHLGFTAYRQGVRTLLVIDTVGTPVYSATGPELGLGSPTLKWLPDRSPALLDSLAVPDRISLSTGGRSRLSPRAYDSNGEPVDAELTLVAHDPRIASVTGDGEVVANRDGTTRISVRTPGGLSRDVEVVVTGGRPPSLLFRETFASLDRWKVYGEPELGITEFEGDSVLDVRGDSRYYDFVFSLDTFSLEGGATLEVDFMLPQNRADKQWQRTCLAKDVWDTEALPENEGRNWSEVDASPVGTVCWRYPGEEMARYERDEVQFSYNPEGIYEIFALPGIDPSRWNRLALEILPDGSAWVYLNGRRIRQMSFRLQDLSGEWRIITGGHDVDTEHYIREITLWRGPHYSGG